MKNIEVTKATDTEKVDAYAIARELEDWFNENGLKDMEIDFAHNNVIVAKEDEKVLGFICYTSYSGK